MSAPVPYKRARPDFADVRVGVACRTRTLLPAAHLANWLAGIGSTLIPASNVSTTIHAGTSGWLRYRVKPIGVAVQRAWLVRARTVSPTEGTTLNVTIGGITRIVEVNGLSERAYPILLNESLSARTSAEQEISIHLSVDLASPTSVIVTSVMCYELPRLVLMQDATDRGIAVETLLSREPVYDVEYASLGGIMDAAANFDRRRRVTLFQRAWPDNTTDCLSTTSAAALGSNLIFPLAVPIIARKRYIGDVQDVVSPRYLVQAPVGTSMQIRCANGGTSVDITHAGTGAWTWVTSSADINVWCDDMTAGPTATPWDELTFSWRRSAGAGTCYLASVGVLDTTT